MSENLLSINEAKALDEKRPPLKPATLTLLSRLVEREILASYEKARKAKEELDHVSAEASIRRAAVMKNAWYDLTGSPYVMSGVTPKPQRE